MTRKKNIRNISPNFVREVATYILSECKVSKSQYFVVMGCVVVTVALHPCAVPLWPSPVPSSHSVLEQQQKTRNIKSNH